MKLIKSIQISILLFIVGSFFAQAAYTAPPLPDEKIAIGDAPPEDGDQDMVLAPMTVIFSSADVSRQVTQIVEQHPVIQNNGVRLLEVKIVGEVVVVDLSQEILPGNRFDPRPFESLTQALDAQLGLQKRYMLTFKVEGKTLDHWGTYAPTVKPVSREIETTQSGPLAGKKIALSPGHGLYYNGSNWVYQRGSYWGIIEDIVNAEMQMYVAEYLENVGATVIYLREPNKNAGNGDSGSPRWKEGTRQYLKYIGAPSSVWDASICNSHTPVNLCKDIMARPYGANYYGADLLISLHNNAGGGTGTETWYDNSGDYHNAASALNLANKIQSKVISMIRSEYNSSWYDRGVRTNKQFGEIYSARMPAALIEVAFFDMQSPDNNALHDEAFKQLTAEAIVLGICDYYGVSCPNVADSTPPTTTAAFAGTAGEDNWYRSDVQITLTATDNSGGTGVKLTQYNIDGGSWQTYSALFTVTGESVHTVTYKAEDNADNVETEKQTIFGIDSTAPTGSLGINNDASVTHATLVSLDTSATDNLSGVSQMRVRDAGDTWDDWQPYIAAPLWLLPGPTGQTFSVGVQFKDRAGNESGVYTDTIPLDIYSDQPASAGYRLQKTTLGASGGASASANYQLRGALGQPSAVNVMSDTNYVAAWGYWRAESIVSPVQAVQAGFTASPVSGVVPLTVTFVNTSAGSYDSSLWNFGDGVSSSLISPTHTYTTTGVYTVSLTVSGSGGSDAMGRSGYINVTQTASEHIVYLPLVVKK